MFNNIKSLLNKVTNFYIGQKYAACFPVLKRDEHHRGNRKNPEEPVA